MTHDLVGKKAKIKQPESTTGMISATNSEDSRRLTDRFTSVIACIDGSHVSKGVIPHAELISTALHAQLQLLTVVEPDHETDAPSDPVEWSLRRREAQNFLDRLVNDFRLDPSSTVSAVLEGNSATAIGNCLSSSQQEITVFCRKDDETGRIGSTTRRVLECCCGSILIVPARRSTSNPVQYQRILVPLDGSPRAESVLPTISTLAKALNATAVIVQAVPHTDVIETTPGDTESEQLKIALNNHNEAAAAHSLDRVSRRLRESGVAVESQILSSGDVRRQLIDAINKESIDLIVLSSHGLSGHQDVPFGDVANHVMTRSPVPALMLRDLTLSSAASVMDRLSDSMGRTPEGAE